MNLYKLYSKPQELEAFHTVKNFDPDFAYDHLRNNDPNDQSAIQCILKKSPWNCFKYAAYVLKQRWPQGEHKIAELAISSYDYAKTVLKGSFKLGEPILAKDGYYAAAYALNVTGKRFIEAEQAIKELAYLYIDEGDYEDENGHFNDGAHEDALSDQQVACDYKMKFGLAHAWDDEWAEEHEMDWMND